MGVGTAAPAATPRGGRRLAVAEPLLWAAAGCAIVLAALAIQRVEEVVALFWLGTLVNAGLSLVKLGLAQVSVHSKALSADAVHGLGDTVAEVVTVLAYTEAARPPDVEHPWGHGKIESMATVLVTGVLLYIAASMGWDSTVTIFPVLARKLRPGAAGCGGAERESGGDGEAPQPPQSGGWSGAGRAAIAVSLASVLLKEALFAATLVMGERTQSNLVVATAWHHRSDSLAAGVSLVSQVGASLGQHYLDSLGGGVVASMLAHSACANLHGSLNDLLDYNPASEEGADIRCGRDLLSRSIVEVQGVLGHSLRTRRMGPYCLADVTIVVDARITASAASMVAESVHDRVIRDFSPFVTDVMVHIDPDGSPQSHHLMTGRELPAAGAGEGRLPLRELLSPEEVDARIRAVLLAVPEGRPDLPRITGITFLQVYYFTDEGVVPAGVDEELEEAAPYVDVTVGFRLASDSATVRSARTVARAARRRVLAVLPRVVRDVDLHLSLDEEADPPADAGGAGAPADAAGCAAPGSWSADMCPRPVGELSSTGRHLRPVTLLWRSGGAGRQGGAAADEGPAPLRR